MASKNKKGFDVLGDVAKSASEAADKVNRELNKAKRVLQGRPNRRQKETVSVSEMKNTKMYVVHGPDSDVLHRRLSEKLEKFVGGKWLEVQLNRDILMNMKFREY